MSDIAGNVLKFSEKDPSGWHTMLKCEGVGKIFRYGGSQVKAVEDVVLTVGPGEKVYVHGPSGAGKSTLLHIMGGLLKPSSGKVTLDGQDIYRIGDKRRSAIRNRRFGFVFQFYHLLPELTVLENVMMPAMISGKTPVGEVKKRAQVLLDSVGIAERSKHLPRKLSGGEMQRCAIARSLINEPEFLFCDEPTGNLDSAMRREIYSLISTLGDLRGMGVIIISHQEVERVNFDSEYIMVDGRLSPAMSEVGVDAGVG